MESPSETTSEVPLSQPLSHRGKSEEHVGSPTPSSSLSERSASVPLLNRGEVEVESQPESRADSQQQQFSVHLQPLHTASESGMFSPNITGRFSVRIASDRPSSVEETPRESPSHAAATAAKHGDHHSIATPSSHLSLSITPSNRPHEPSASPSQARTPPPQVVSEESSSLTNTQEFSAASVMSSEPVSERTSASESLEATIASSSASSDSAVSSSVAPSTIAVDDNAAEATPSESLAATAPPSYFSPRTPSEQASFTPRSTSTSSFSPAHAALLSAASTPASLKINANPCCVICAKSNDLPLIPGAQGLYFHAGCLAPAGISQTPSSGPSNPISPTAAASIEEPTAAVNDDEEEEAGAAATAAATIEVQLLRAELARVKLQQEEQQREQVEFEHTHGTKTQFMRDAATAFATAMSPRTQKAAYEEKQQSLEYEHTHTPFHNIAHPYTATHSLHPALSTETLITPASSLATLPHPPHYPVPTHQMPFPVLSELDRAVPAPLPGLTAFNVEFPRNSVTARNVQPAPPVMSPFHKPSNTTAASQKPQVQNFAPPAWGSTVYQPKCEGDAGRSLLYETAEEREEREREEAGNEYFPPEISEYAQADEWVANYDSSALNIYRGWGTVKKMAPPAPAPAPAPVPYPKPPAPAPPKQVLYAAAPIPARPPSPKEILYEAPPQRTPPASTPSNGMFWADLHPTLNPDPASNANYPRSHPLPPMSPLTQMYSHHGGKSPSQQHYQEDYAATKKRMNHARY